MAVFPLRASVSVAVVNERQLLLVQEASPRKRGRWNLPSGRLNPGEQFLDAAIREALEETGFTVELVGVVGFYSYVSASKRRVVRCMYKARPIGTASAVTANDEILDRCWWSLDALDELEDRQLWAPHILRPMLEDIRQGGLYPLDIVKWFPG